VEVRRAAVESLAAIGGQQTLEPLTKALRDTDAEVQRTAILGLVNFYLPGYYQSGWRNRVKRMTLQIADRYSDKDEPVVPAYVKARPEIVTGIGAIAAASPVTETRTAAIRAIGALRGREASEQILSALATKNSDILYEVMIALEKMGDRELAPRVFYLLRDPDERVQIATIQTVAVLGHRDAIVPMREAWERTKNDRVKRVLLEAMAMFADESNRPLFEQHILHQDEYLRAGAAEGFARLGHAEDLTRLSTLWEGERKMRPRLSLAFAMAALGRREIDELSPLQYLINTLNSRAWQGVAKAYLKELAAEAAVRFSLHNAMLQGTRDEKLAIAGILGERGSKDSLEILESAARDSDAEVATESSRALRLLRLRLQ
jgi:HEAT repeat protein